MEGTIGEIRLFSGSFAPKYWAFCAGQLLSVSSNTALFSIIGTTYGGNGQTTFALPDLQGRVPVGTGSGAGLSEYVLGQMGGTPNETLTQLNLPPHAHNLQGTLQVGGSATQGSPGNAVPGVTGFDAYSEDAGSGTMAANLVAGQSAVVGGSQPVPITQPYEGMNYIICLTGVYPSRP